MVKIRLARHGAKKAPFYRIVVTDQRQARDAKCIEEIGRYNPRTAPILIEVDLEKYDSWVAKGAQTSDTVTRLVTEARSRKAAE